jgi:ParB/RepB/Spo0J family partition protein
MELEFHQLDRRWEDLRIGRPERRRRLLASLAAIGQQTPIVVVASQPGRYLVIDGYKRVAALEQLGRDTVEAAVWPMSEAEAIVLDRSMRFSERETALEEGWLLAALEHRFGYELDELARRFDRSVGWVMRRLALVDLLPQGVQEQVREGKISAHVATKYLAPVARVSRDDCQRLADGLARHRFTSRQAGQLYAAWRDGSPVQRQRLVEQPELFLKVQQQAGPAAVGGAGAKLLRDLDMVVAITKRANQRAGHAALEMDRRQCAAARRQIECAREQLDQLGRAIASREEPKEEEYVEQRSADSDSGTRGAGSEPSPDRPGNETLPADGAPRHRIEIVRGAGAAAAGESRTLPPGNLGTAKGVQRESGPGP